MILEFSALDSQVIDRNTNEEKNPLELRRFFHQEVSLDKIDKEIYLLNSPCPYLPLAIEKALVSRNLILGKKWGQDYTMCRPLEPTTLFHYGLILRLAGEREEMKKTLENSMGLSPPNALRKRIVKLLQTD